MISVFKLFTLRTILNTSVLATHAWLKKSKSGVSPPGHVISVRLGTYGYVNGLPDGGEKVHD